MRKISVCILVLSLFACTPAAQNEGENASDNVADKLTFEDLDGNQIDASQWKGHYVFINFWATWCKPCVMELPSIEAMGKDFADESLSVVLVSNEKAERVKKFMASNDVISSSFIMPTAAETFGLEALPTSLLIDPNGNVLMRHKGARKWDSIPVKEELRSLIKGTSSL